MRILALLLLVPAAAFAECPPVADHDAELAELFEAARAAPSEAAARPLMNAMWEIWTDAPDEPSAELLKRGMGAIRVADHLTALDAFDKLTAYCPDYAEGWNQRAFVHFLSGEHEAALADLERTVALSPTHVGALSGLALTLTALGREAEAQHWLRAALALNPWIAERHLLKPEAAPGTDL